jgi:glucose/arabinose dehydrogenase/cytochrome c2
MRSIVAIGPVLLLGFAAVGSAAAADAVAGKSFFSQQCALCHSAQPNDNGGAQGPNLHGILARRAASGEAFSYTKALRRSNLTWDAATLDRFLKSPSTVVPGSAMAIAVQKQDDRDNLIAYFQAVKDGTFKDAPARSFTPPPNARGAASAAQADADWKQDAPGRVHRIDLAKLAKPYETSSAVNFPRLIERPADATLQLPPGFRIDVYARDLKGPRTLRVAPNGDVFVSQTQSGRISVLRPTADGLRAASVKAYAQGLNLPSGMAFYPAGAHPQWLYVAENNRVVRYAYTAGDQSARAVPEVVVHELSPVAGGGHFTRDIAFSNDGKRMFISVGSQSNVAETMGKKTPDEIKAWEAERGLGAAWGNETKRAAVLVFDVGADKPGRIYANGIRNCVGLTSQPATGALWCTTNERDMLGDNLVPDYATRVQQGGFYGWPWYYMGNHEDPRLAGQRPDLAGKAIVPDVPFQAHSAALNLVFYTATTGAAAFPKEYLGDGFVMMHGSWNRSFRTGHKIVRLRMKDGVPTGEYEDFLTGFIATDGNAWGRPVSAAVANDGALLMSDDSANLIYRIAYAGK